MKELEAWNPNATLYAHWMKGIHQQAEKALQATRSSMNKYYDKKAKKPPTYKIGKKVMLNARNIRTKRPSKKLAPKLYGPFEILEKHGNLAYKLKLSERWKIHPVFHVSLLEPFRESKRPNREQPPTEPEEIEGDLVWEVEKIIKSELIKYQPKINRRKQTIKELRYFAKWKGLPNDENPWEPPENLE